MCEESTGNETILSNAQITNFYAECIDDAAKALKDIFGKKKMALGISDEDIFGLANTVIVESGFLKDIKRFAESDPAAKGSFSYVYRAYKGIKAIMYYRIARGILIWDALYHVDKGMVAVIVRTLCEKEKVETGIDIHPSAQIGEGCVIDHGIGVRIGVDAYENSTVIIGETVIIGKNCTILNDVVIGAADVNQGESEGRRHPEIGNDVTICAGAKILGRIIVGNRVFIGPGCRIIHDIPSDSKVLIVNQLQIISIKDTQPVILDGVVSDGTNLLLYGENIKEVELVAVGEDYGPENSVAVSVLERTKRCVTFTMKARCQMETDLRNIHLKVVSGEKYFFVSSDVIRRYLKKTI